MNLFAIVRMPIQIPGAPTPDQDEPPRVSQVLVGSSPISGKPYWGNPGTEATTQPLLFRSRGYCAWCLEIAEREDRKAGDISYSYAIEPVDFPFFTTTASQA